MDVEAIRFRDIPGKVEWLGKRRHRATEDQCTCVKYLFRYECGHPVGTRSFACRLKKSRGTRKYVLCGGPILEEDP